MANEVRIVVKSRDEASAEMDRVKTKAEGLGLTLGTAVRGGAVAAGTAIAGFGVASVMAAADFEYAIDQVGAVAGATEEQMRQLSNAALAIGRDTMFGATEAAGAMEILAANGITVEQILGGAARAAVDLAAAGGTDLRTAADAASTSMTLWSLSATDMTEVVNRLAGAANVSRFGVEDMSGAIAQGGGVAAQAGVTFGDFSTAIAAIAPAFSSGSDAGTSFKAFLNALTPSSAAAEQAMRDLGIITADGSNRFFDATGKMRSMAEITDVLHQATRGMTDAQRLSTLETIFGSDAMRAAGQISALTREDFIRMSDTMRDTSAQDVAAQRMDNFKGSIEQLKGTVDTWMIQLGLVVMPALNDLAQWINMVGIPAIEEWASENREELEAVKDAFIVFTQIVLPVLEAFVTSVLALFQFMFDVISGTFMVFKGLFTADFDLFMRGLNTLAEAPLNLLRAQFEAAWNMVNSITDGALERLRVSVSNSAGDVINTVSRLPGAMAGALSSLPSVLANAGANGMAQFLNGVGGVFWGSVMQFFSGIPGAIVGQMGNLGNLLWNKGKELIEGFVRGMLSVPIPNPVDLVPDVTPWDGISPIGFGGRRIPGFASGGMVPGPMGSPMLAVVHGGERVLTPAQQAGGGGGVTLVYAPTFSAATPVEAQRFVRWIKEQLQGEASLAWA